ncbi:hypothetical protein Tco_1334273 [Tanacetum coccineum]
MQEEELHGRMKSDKKDEALRRFRSGETAFNSNAFHLANMDLVQRGPGGDLLGSGHLPQFPIDGNILHLANQAKFFFGLLIY